MADCIHANPEHEWIYFELFMDSVISTGFSLHVTNLQKRVRSDHTMNSRQSQTAARNPCNVEMRMLKGGGDFEVFLPPVLAAASPLHGYLLEAKCHTHGASGFQSMNLCDWLRLQILISPSFCLLVAHTSHRPFFSPQLQLHLFSFFFFFFAFQISLCRHHMRLSDASTVFGDHRRLCL